MRTIVFSFLLAAATFASAADNTPLSGKWQLHTTVSDRETDWNCSFTQTGNDITGTCSSAAGAGSVSGKVDDKKVTWTYKINSEANGTITLKYRGAINSATSITGYVTVEEYGLEGEFAATASN